jgi:outer membrane protein assembly factor BamB
MNSELSEASSNVARDRRALRLWPVAAIILLWVVGMVIVWFKPGVSRQHWLIRTWIVSLWALLLLFFWAVLFSRLPVKVRLSILGIVVACVGAGFGLLEIRGVTGDLRPIVAFRWTPRSSAVVAPAPKARVSTQTKTATAVSFSEFMGPHRNGVLEGPALETDWTTHPPKLLWRHAVNGSWSGFAISGSRAITQEQREENETIVCYDLFSGGEIWTHNEPGHYLTKIAGEGPRSTPTISSNYVVTASALGGLSVVNLETGKLLWSTNVLKSHEAHLPDWGFACSPLVVGDRVIVTAGGSKNSALVCYALQDGKELWSAGSGGADYSSPVLIELNGIQQIVAFQSKVRGCSLDGKMLWEYSWPGGHPHISLPVQIGRNQLLVSSGYGTGAELLRFTTNQQGELHPERVWKSIALKSKFGPLLVRDGFVYGLDDGMFTCVDLANGQRKWKDGRYGHGQGLLVKDVILLMTEPGEVVLIRPSPEKFEELARLPVFSEKTWNPPALAGPYLVVRDETEAACFELPTRSVQTAAQSQD